MFSPPALDRTLRLASLAILLGALLVGCRTSPRAASAAPSPAPSSIAYADSAPTTIHWTTPEQAELPRITRNGDGVIVATSGPGSEQVGPGTAVERRFQGQEEAGPWELVTTIKSTWVSGGGFSAGGSAPDLWINRLRLSLEKSTGAYGRFGAFGTYVNRQYSWGATNPLLPSVAKPFEAVHTFRVGANHFQPLSEKWAAFLMVTGSWSATDTSNLSDAFSWSLSGLIGRRISPKFDVGIGFVVGKLFEDDIYIFAGPQFGWRPTERISLTLEGTQLDFSYTPSDKWELGVSGAFIISRFRLSDSAPQSSQIVQDWRLPIWARARYRAIENLDIEFRLGLDAYRVWSIEDAAGNNSRSYASDPAPLIGLRLIWQL